MVVNPSHSHTTPIVVENCLSNFLALSGGEGFCSSPLGLCLAVDTPAKYFPAILIASLGMGGFLLLWKEKAFI